jgi:integrase
MSLAAQRRCESCGRPLGSTSRPDRRYCGAACRQAGYERRRRAARASSDDTVTAVEPAPALLAELEAAVERATDEMRLVATVAAAAPTNWRAAAWLLSRRWPERWELDLYIGGQLTRGTRTKPARVVSRKSGAEPYTTLILPALEDELTRRLEAELADGRGQPDDFVLAMPRTGRPPHQRTLTDAVKAAATSAGLGHVTPQMLRRSFASIAARRVPDPAEAAHMTGHSLDVWVRHYVGRFGADARADARQRLLDAGLGIVEAAHRPADTALPLRCHFRRDDADSATSAYAKTSVFAATSSNRGAEI